MATEQGRGTALASRFQQMFPVLSAAEIDRVRRFGDLQRFRPGEFLCRVGKPSPGMFVILSGRVAVVGLDWQRPVSPDIHDTKCSVAVSGFALLWSLDPGEIEPSEQDAAHTWPQFLAPVLLWPRS